MQNPIAVIFLLFMVFQSIKGGMPNNLMDWFIQTIILLPGIIVAISFHEFAHAKVASLCGDPTPRLQGRVTINPIAHIDPIGFIALIFIKFGWGKPVMISPKYFKRPRRDEFLVAVAGVTLNLVLALIFMGILRLLYEFQGTFMNSEIGDILGRILYQVVYFNIVLMLFNLLPIPPLDGFNIITQIFNLRNTRFYYQVYDKGFIILMTFIFFNITGRILTPAIIFIQNTLFSLFF